MAGRRTVHFSTPPNNHRIANRLGLPPRGIKVSMLDDGTDAGRIGESKASDQSNDCRRSSFG